nr:hypothetical protein [Tanacetum cinerariifolium]
MIMLYRFTAHSLPSLVSWLGSHTDNVNAAVYHEGHEGHVCALLGQHNDESIIAFLVDGFIQKADGFASVFLGVPEQVYHEGHEGHVCALLGQHNDESIIAFLVDGFIQKADGFAGVFSGTKDTIKCPLNAQDLNVKCCVNAM